jgi:hypothetical protein
LLSYPAPSPKTEQWLVLIRTALVLGLDKLSLPISESSNVTSPHVALSVRTHVTAEVK